MIFNRLSPAYKGIVLALAGYTFFSFCDACTKWLTQYYPPHQIVAVYTGIASLAVLSLAKHLGGYQDLFEPKNIKIHALRGFLNFALTVMVMFCFQHLSIASLYIMIFTVPFIAVFLSIPLYKEKVSPARWAAIVLGFTGVLIAFAPGAGFDPILILAFLIAFMIALLYVVTKFLHKPSVFSLGFSPSFGAFLLSLPLLLFNYSPIDLAHIPIFIMAGILSAGGLTCISTAFRIAPTSAVSPFMYTQIIWGIILGYLVFGDRPDIWMFIGAAVIIVSGIFIIGTERREQKIAS